MLEFQRERLLSLEREHGQYRNGLRTHTLLYYQTYQVVIFCVISVIKSPCSL